LWINCGLAGTEEQWYDKILENMGGDGVNIKSYDIVVGSSAYKLNLRKFDSNGDGESDTVGFQVLPSVEEIEDEDEL